ncbi:MAG: hypothetical protein M3198_13335 [Actinomycetota bacterium]|nr:hypothetical protein [Actinomycetota bacterium]
MKHSEGVVQAAVKEPDVQAKIVRGDHHARAVATQVPNVDQLVAHVDKTVFPRYVGTQAELGRYFPTEIDGVLEPATDPCPSPSGILVDDRRLYDNKLRAELRAPVALHEIAGACSLISTEPNLDRMLEVTSKRNPLATY